MSPVLPLLHRAGSAGVNVVARLWSGVAMSLMLLGPCYAEPSCVPVLRLTDVRFSDMLEPSLERRWVATVLADASGCAAANGVFEIAFVRSKENGPNLEFRERFAWATPSTAVTLVVSGDEAIERYWIARVATCTCTTPP